MKRKLIHPSNRASHSWYSYYWKRKFAIGVVGVLLLAISLSLWYHLDQASLLPLHTLLLDSDRGLDSSLLTSSSSSFSRNRDKLLPQLMHMHLPAFGTCQRIQANHFLNLDYDYHRMTLSAKQQIRDADLQDLRLLDIFDSSSPTKHPNPMTHRWAGINLATDPMLEWAQRVVAPWRHEWSTFPNSARAASNPKLDYYRNNGMHDGSDPILLHSFVRSFLPSRVLEVGSGFSSRVTAAALARNVADCPGGEVEFTVIDPVLSRMSRVDGKIVGPTDVHNVWIENERLSFLVKDFLQPGDLFFIDSSHALGEGGSGTAAYFTDVMVEYAEILPRLPPGVFVHVHDIAFPDHAWFYERNWAEQFILQALLMNNPYFDVLWSGGALNMPWALLEFPDDPSVITRVDATRKAAVDAVGQHLHVYEVGKKRPFAGGGSLWMRRNTRPFLSPESVPPNNTTKEFLMNPMRTLPGMTGTTIQEQLPFLQSLTSKYDEHKNCQAGRIADCVVCAFLSNAPGKAHLFDVDRLASFCSSANEKVESHKRQYMLEAPLKFFTSLHPGDTIVLGGAHLMMNTAGNARALASTIFIMEVAPRLPPGVNVVLYGGLHRDLTSIVSGQQNEPVGTFLVQAWLTMNDGVQILWYEDSMSAQEAGFPASSHTDHVVIVKIV